MAQILIQAVFDLMSFVSEVLVVDRGIDTEKTEDRITKTEDRM